MSKLSTLAMTLSIVFMLLAAAGCGQDKTPGDKEKSTGAKPRQEQRQDPGLIAATVTRVVDGDTVIVKLAGESEEKVRLIGVDTPESTRNIEPYGKEASAYAKSMLDGGAVWLELDVGERDRYGRLLAYVWLKQPAEDSEAEVRSKMFNADLLLNGYAQIMTVPPNVKYADLFVKLQQEARDAGKGLWGLDMVEKEEAGG